MKFPNDFVKATAEDRPTIFWVREAGPKQDVWTCEAEVDGEGHVFLDHGWSEFARAYDLQEGSLLTFRYRRGNPQLRVKIFDGTTCRQSYGPLAGGGGRLC